MNKPKLTQKYGGWVCTGVHPCTDGSVIRWAETPEEAYEEYLKACKEVEEMRREAKMHGAIAHIPLHKMTQGDVANIEAVDYTRPVYSSYDIYENVEEQDYERLLKDIEILKKSFPQNISQKEKVMSLQEVKKEILSILLPVAIGMIVVLLLINMKEEILYVTSFVVEMFENLR